MIEMFLTAYDPFDLPGTSIDPLGFERGYLYLADKILPGLDGVFDTFNTRARESLPSFR